MFVRDVVVSSCSSTELEKSFGHTNEIDSDDLAKALEATVAEAEFYGAKTFEALGGALDGSEAVMAKKWLDQQEK